LPACGCRSLRLLPEVAPERLQNINQARYPDEVRDDRPCELACNLERTAPARGRRIPLCAASRERELTAVNSLAGPAIPPTGAKAEKCPRFSQRRRGGGIEQIEEVRVIAQGIELPCGRGAWGRANGSRRWLGRRSSGCGRQVAGSEPGGCRARLQDGGDRLAACRIRPMAEP
jgi:hypothetical protein